MEEESVKQIDSKPWLWKKGQSGNPKGRKKGKTMKDYARDLLSKMTEEERLEYLEGLPKEIIWKMAEGNPKTDTDITSGGRPIVSIDPIIAKKNGITPSTKTDSE